MKASDLQTLVAREFGKLDNWADRDIERRRLVNECQAAAEDGERRHRRMGRSLMNHGYKVGVETAAKWFVLKWATERRTDGPKSWAHAASVRLDCLYGWAIGELLGADAACPNLATDAIHSVHYETDIA